MYEKIIEGKAEIFIPTESKISKKLPVFYNPLMKYNRDITIALFDCVEDKDIVVGDILGGSGVRTIRMFKELSKDKIKSVFVNDSSSEAVKIIIKNLKENKIKNYKILNLGGISKIPKKTLQKKNERNIYLTNLDANQMMRASSGFDYIDVDPFGTPNPFLDSAIMRLSRKGMLGVTATDTSALCGTYLNACRRKYWAEPKRGECMHEIGLRILIRKVQLIGAQYEKALTPIYSYSKEHYMRVFFRCKKGKKEVDKILKQHSEFKGAGPLYTGELWDKKTAKKIAELIKDKFTQTIYSESLVGGICYHSVSKIAKKNKIAEIPKKELILKKIKEKGFKASNTHFEDDGIRSDIDEKELIEILKLRYNQIKNRK